MKARIRIFILILLIKNASSQNYTWPIDSPLIITGNYGELRPNHFHAGIDFTTNGRENLPVYASEKGTISRIKINSAGYGKCIYIAHDNGQTTVYAHLNKFANEIAKVIEEEQYKQKKYEVDFIPQNIKIIKKQLIAYSGNTGNSTGPHLHFEIRDSKSEIPQNPLRILKYSDTIKPNLTHVLFYNLNDTSNPKPIKAIALKIDEINPIPINLPYKTIGIGFSGYDISLHNGNKNNIYEAKLFCDDNLIYHHKLGGIAFEEQKFVNEFSQKFEEKKFQKCFLPTVFPVGLYVEAFNKGRLLFNDSAIHKIKILVFDESGNNSSKTFYIKSKLHSEFIKSKGNITVNCSEKYYNSVSGISLFIPEKTLYYTQALTLENKIEQNGSFALLPLSVNLKSGIKLALKVPEKFSVQREKIAIQNGNTVLVPKLTNDSLVFFTSSLGMFQLKIDSVAPTIKKINRSNNQQLIFQINDNLSGIGNYNLYLNEAWTLIEFDFKTKRLIYTPNTKTPKGKTNLKLEIEDKVGNKTIHHEKIIFTP
ncbi:MAG: M23 family metallopeptidase [Bacteroidetes bacterium]|nr:M23 family metallopeptidase [Bacteroidota bacterium]